MDLKKRGKCIILVTNALQFLKQSSHIVVLKDGRIVESGKYNQLLQSGKGFTEMISTMQDTSSGSATGSSLSGKRSAGEGGGEGVEVGVESAGLTIPAVNAHANTVTTSTTTAASATPTTTAAAKRKSSTESDSKVSIKKSASLITAEDRETGDVSIQVYGKWAVAAGGLYVGKFTYLKNLKNKYRIFIFKTE